ncbi:hypothetical protein [Terricaulis sp.]|uniref:hypothetical protein n=1 Tax=Terricaulis sp. TaxID=2768686 RepID=UPI003784E11C
MQSSACIWCNCGAKYERVEVRLPIKDIGIFECQFCGEVLERWSGRLVPAFKLVSPPDSEASHAA